MNAKDEYLMTCPGIPPQPFCAVCGDTFRVQQHHVVRRSQGGTEGPTLPLCETCHKSVHDLGILDFDYDADDGWLFCWLPDGEWDCVRVWNEYDQSGAQRASDPTTETRRQRIVENLRLAAMLDYIISCDLADDARATDRKATAEWVSCDEDLVSRRSVDSWLSRRIAYAALPQEAAPLGITKGYMVARLVEAGHPVEQVLADLSSMPRAAFDAVYGLGRPKAKHQCPDCGATHVKKEGCIHG